MLRYYSLLLFLALSCSLASLGSFNSMATAEEPAKPEVEITADVVYGHKFGLAMTLDVFKPSEKANGAGVLFMVSGGWYSHWTPPEQLRTMFRPLTDAGYTVFAVRHGSSPKFEISEAVDDVRQSVRFIRLNASRFAVDPERLGVFGMSAGGHLSLMLGTSGDDGDANSSEPVRRASSRVQAVAAWVAPTDLKLMVRGEPTRLPAYDRFPALELDMKSASANSPLDFASADDAPALLLVGGKDDLVPAKHSEMMHRAFQKVGVATKMVVFQDSGHSLTGADQMQAVDEMLKWFDRHLLKDKAEP
jgi:acetyl esterase/lipase